MPDKELSPQQKKLLKALLERYKEEQAKITEKLDHELSDADKKMQALIEEFSQGEDKVKLDDLEDKLSEA